MNNPDRNRLRTALRMLIAICILIPAFSQSEDGAKKVTVDLTAKNFRFSRSEITVPAGAEVLIRFTNRDDGIPHNVSVYTDSTAKTAIFKGKILTDSGKTEYTFTAPSEAGTYYFRCDIHPAQMNGAFIVSR